MKTIKERDTLDLLELTLQLHSRALNYPNVEIHNNFIEAKTELENRIKLKQEPKYFEERKELSYELQYKNLKERYDLLSEKYLKLNSDYLDKCKKEAPKETKMKQKITPLANAIEEIKNNKKLTDFEKGYIIHILSKQLAEEKQMVIDAYKEGCFDNILDERTDKIRAEQYFNQNFKQ